MRMPAYIRVNGHREAEIVVFPVEIVKMISPQRLDDLWVHPSVAVGRFLDEHHWRQVVEIPIGRDLDEAGVRAGD